MANSWEGPLPYFSKGELACQHCGVIRLDPEFAVHLPMLRHTWGAPLRPTSVCRCPEHNAAVKGHPRSLHKTDNPDRKKAKGTMAIDISWMAWPIQRKLRFARTAWLLGWSVGLHNRFCHLDRRTAVGLPRKVFLYGQWAGEFDAYDVTGTESGAD